MQDNPIFYFVILQRHTNAVTMTGNAYQTHRDTGF